MSLINLVILSSREDEMVVFCLLVKTNCTSFGSYSKPRSLKMSFFEARPSFTARARSFLLDFLGVPLPCSKARFLIAWRLWISLSWLRMASLMNSDCVAYTPLFTSSSISRFNCLSRRRCVSSPMIYFVYFFLYMYLVLKDSVLKDFWFLFGDLCKVQIISTFMLIYLDTNVYLDYLLENNDIRPLDEYARLILNRSLSCEFTILVSDLVLAEMKKKDIDTKALLQPLRLQQKIIHREVEKQDVARAKSISIHYPDNIHLALAMRTHCQFFVTNDKELLALEEDIQIVSSQFFQFQ